jgi:hypothetical protein
MPSKQDIGARGWWRPAEEQARSGAGVVDAIRRWTDAKTAQFHLPVAFSVPCPLCPLLSFAFYVVVVVAAAVFFLLFVRVSLPRLCLPVSVFLLNPVVSGESSTVTPLFGVVRIRGNV